MTRYCLAVLLIFFVLPLHAAEDPDIRDLMTAEEFAASGLSRLSEEEFAAINRWLVRYTAQDSETVLGSSPAVQEVTNAGIKSQIDGEFRGWNGPTRFPLKNGQLWETNSTRRYNFNAIDPEVEISRNWMGIYRMRIVETGKSINVRRIR